MPQTPYKGLEIPATGTLNETWGTVFNASVLDIVDTNMGSVLNVAVSASNVFLTATEARSAMIHVTGVISTPLTIVNPAQGFWFIENLTSGVDGLYVWSNVGSFINIPQSTRAMLFSDTANGIRIFGIATLTNPDVVPTGTQMLFVSGAVPSGWTLYTALDDYALTLSSTTGAGTSGSVAFSTLFGRTATDSHTITGAELPPHAHNITLNVANGGGGDSTARWSGGSTVYGSGARNTEPTGGGQGHTHNVDLRVLNVTTIIGIRQ